MRVSTVEILFAFGVTGRVAGSFGCTMVVELPTVSILLMFNGGGPDNHLSFSTLQSLKMRLM